MALRGGFLSTRTGVLRSKQLTRGSSRTVTSPWRLSSVYLSCSSNPLNVSMRSFSTTPSSPSSPFSTTSSSTTKTVPADPPVQGVDPNLMAQASARGGDPRAELAASVKYCVEYVKSHDPEGYIACVFLPKQHQSAAFVIRALNAELAAVKEEAETVTARELRFMWWKNEIDECLKLNPSTHPVSLALSAVAHKYTLQPKWLKTLVDARAADLDDRGLASMDHLEQFGEATGSAVLYLTLQAMGITDLTADHAASHIGRANALVSSIRSVPAFAPQGLCLLPGDIVNKHEVDNVFGLNEPLQAAVYDMACMAHAHVHHARQLNDDVPEEARLALLPAVLLTRYLDTLEKYNFDPFAGPLRSAYLHNLGPSRLLLHFNLLKHKWNKTY